VFFEHGYLGTTSRRIVTTAGVSSSAFYHHFDDVSDCLRAAFEVASASLLRMLAGRCQDVPERRSRARSGTEALLTFCRAEPQLSRLLGAELPAAQKEIAPRHWQLISRLAALLDGREGREPPVQGAAVGRHLAAAALALSCDGEESLTPLQPDLATQLTALLELAREHAG
jgi:AcrR family transcriptional regulator